MSRLIDADYFKTEASAMAVKLNWDTQKAVSFLKIIDNQPTAYDVDKVVEQLEQCKLAYPLGTWCDMVEEAKEIVKGGGQ